MSTNLLCEIIWLLLVMAVTVGTSSSMAAKDAKPGCPTQCGNLTVPYPFGIGPKCSLNPLYSLECDKSYDPPKAFTQKLNSSSTSFQVFNIFETQIHVNGMIAYKCPPSNGTLESIISSKDVKFLPPLDSPFTLSSTANFFSLAGSCDYFAPVLTPRNYAENITCPLSCYGKNGYTEFVPGICALGNGCCKRPIRNHVENGFSLEVEYSEKVQVKLHSTCGYVFVGKEDSLVIRHESDYSDPAFVKRTRDNVVMVLDWVVGNQTCREASRNPSSYACQHNTSCIDGASGGYRCACLRGYQGNPYLSPGCTDKNECAAASSPCYKKAVCNNTQGDYICTCPKGYHGDGRINGSGCIPNSVFTLLPFKLTLGLSLGLLSLIVIGSGTNILIRKHRLAKTREKFFKQNGGLMLKEKLSSSKVGSSSFNSFKLFTMEELKKATKNFCQDLIVGIGGYGTVYRGTLRDETVVAVKMSKMVDDTQIEQFINETVILTQIHHRNVVKLLGCCLEAEIPILVYEFIANGSLLQHIHGESNRLTWIDRLRIATETATALGYLHSATSTPIIHRDIKSANILLDDNYSAKISDFGASRLIPMDKTQMSTLVQGTLGYMDPEYLISSQLTDKSDVYGFGVVVAELMTGEKPLSTERRMGDRNLAKYFVNHFKQGRVLDIIDPRIVDEAPPEQLRWVAEIIHECLDVKGANRPTMKDVAVELAGIQRQTIELSEDLYPNPNTEENRNPRQDDVREAWNNQSYSMSDFSFTIEAR